MSSAGSKVYLLPELLELILLESTTFDILVATSVCTYSRDLIESSARLKHKLQDVPYFNLSTLFRNQSPKTQLNTRSSDPWLFGMLNAQRDKLLILQLPQHDVQVYMMLGWTDQHIRVLNHRYALELFEKKGLGSNMRFLDDGGEVAYETDYPTRWHPEAVFAQYLRTFYPLKEDERQSEANGKHESSCRECMLYII